MMICIEVKGKLPHEGEEISVFDGEEVSSSESSSRDSRGSLEGEVIEKTEMSGEDCSTATEQEREGGRTDERTSASASVIASIPEQEVSPSPSQIRAGVTLTPGIARVLLGGRSLRMHATDTSSTDLNSATHVSSLSIARALKQVNEEIDRVFSPPNTASVAINKPVRVVALQPKNEKLSVAKDILPRKQVQLVKTEVVPPPPVSRGSPSYVEAEATAVQLPVVSSLHSAHQLYSRQISRKRGGGSEGSLFASAGRQAVGVKLPYQIEAERELKEHTVFNNQLNDCFAKILIPPSTLGGGGSSGGCKSLQLIVEENSRLPSLYKQNGSCIATEHKSRGSCYQPRINEKLIGLRPSQFVRLLKPSPQAGESRSYAETTMQQSVRLEKNQSGLDRLRGYEQSVFNGLEELKSMGAGVGGRLKKAIRVDVGRGTTGAEVIGRGGRAGIVINRGTPRVIGKETSGLVTGRGTSGGVTISRGTPGVVGNLRKAILEDYNSTQPLPPLYRRTINQQSNEKLNASVERAEAAFLSGQIESISSEKQEGDEAEAASEGNCGEQKRLNWETSYRVDTSHRISIQATNLAKEIQRIDKLHERNDKAISTFLTVQQELLAWRCLAAATKCVEVGL